MTPIERFFAITNFQEPDRLWRWETIGFWRETLSRWHNEGLPKIINNEVFAFLYFKFDPIIPIIVGASSTPNLFPPYTRKVIERKKNYKIVREPSGEIVQVFANGSSSIPKFIGFPVKNASDFKKILWRLNPDFPCRVDNPFNNFLIALSKSLKCPLSVSFCGLFAMKRFLLGFEKLMITYYDDPELLHTIGKTWQKLCINYIHKLRKKTKIHLIQFWEDMCYKAGPIISPKTFREFMSPYYKNVIDAAKEDDVRVFLVDTDGDCTQLIPLFIESGVNCMLPFEVQSGMDIRKVRDEFEKKLIIVGGLDKRKLAGAKEEVKEEIYSKVPYMLKTGGYIPALDHCVPPEVSLRNFKYFLRTLRNVV